MEAGPRGELKGTPPGLTCGRAALRLRRTSAEQTRQWQWSALNRQKWDIHERPLTYGLLAWPLDLPISRRTFTRATPCRTSLSRSQPPGQPVANASSETFSY